MDGEEFLECLNNNLGCFIAEFLDFKPSGVIVCVNGVDFQTDRWQFFPMDEKERRLT